jgi:dienelactone hydrolase
MKQMTSFFAVVAFIFLSVPFNLLGEEQDAGSELTPMVIENGGTGPYKAVALGEKTLPKFTIYRPQNLDDFGLEQKVPVLLWGNGGCADSSAMHRLYLNEIASHGFIVFAVGPFSSLYKPPQMGPMGGDREKISLLEALDWAIVENSRKSSVYFGKLDTDKVAAMGMSCGGLQALEVSPDPRVDTSVICNSGILNGPPPAGLSMPVLIKDTLKQLHSPIIYIIGGPKDIAYPNAMDDFKRIEKVPVAIINLDVGHGGTYAQPHGGAFSGPTIAWLKWQLNGDEEAALMFKGEKCGLCMDTEWEIETNNIN